MLTASLLTGPGIDEYFVRADTSGAIALLTDAQLHRRVASAALQTVRTKFCQEKIVPLYEAYYEEILRAGGAGTAPARPALESQS